MMVYDILWGMHGARNGRGFIRGLGMLKEIVGKLVRDGPFIVRIITIKKFYSGLLEELKLINNCQLKFRVHDCDSDGRTNGTAGIFKDEVRFEDLKDIQIVFDKNGQPVFFSDLFPDIFRFKNGD